MTKARWIQVFFFLALVFSLGWLIFGDTPLLSGQKMRELGAEHPVLTAGVSVGLLVVDLALPVPNGVVMTVNGQLFGFWGGAAVSFVGQMSAWILCYWLGRLFGWGLGKRRKSPAPPPDPAAAEPEDTVAEDIRRFGVLMLMATRAVPILGEVLAAAAGVARMNWWRFLFAVAVGTLPMGLIYAWFGSRSTDPQNTAIALAVAIGLPLVLYAVVARPWKNSRDQGSGARD